jgi:multidrug efflux pump subunit AcrA (membrane-fusion protein)
MYIIGILLLVLLFIPWTQNIRSYGKVTALKPQQRPQTIQNIIAGRIEKWFVQEGQFVKKGDTIIQISEIKSEYLNPDLVANSESQLKAKSSSVKSYMEKVGSIDDQISAIIVSRKLKLEQAENKLKQSLLKYNSDSIELSAIKLNEKVAKDQLKRIEELYKEGLKSLTDLEARRIKLQEFQVKTIAQENKIINSKNDVINAQIEIQNINTEFREKVSKMESDKNATLSSLYEAEAAVTKLQNDYTNYNIRSGFYFITAPQDGFITKAINSGIGETIKEGSEIVSIMPFDYDLAVEMYVRPIDIPLLHLNQPVNILFDGWPSIIFSGWPGLSYGTFRGTVVAIDNFISENGRYRILISPDKQKEKWPKEIRLGAGASGFILLKDVPIWYELWRQVNGFPPDFYQKNFEKSKAPKENKEK